MKYCGKTPTSVSFLHTFVMSFFDDAWTEEKSIKESQVRQSSTVFSTCVSIYSEPRAFIGPVCSPCDTRWRWPAHNSPARPSHPTSLKPLRMLKVTVTFTIDWTKYNKRTRYFKDCRNNKALISSWHAFHVFSFKALEPILMANARCSLIDVKYDIFASGRH